MSIYESWVLPSHLGWDATETTGKHLEPLEERSKHFHKDEGWNCCAAMQECAASALSAAQDYSPSVLIPHYSIRITVVKSPEEAVWSHPSLCTDLSH